MAIQPIQHIQTIKTKKQWGFSTTNQSGKRNKKSLFQNNGLEHYGLLDAVHAMRFLLFSMMLRQNKNQSSIQFLTFAYAKKKCIGYYGLCSSQYSKEWINKKKKKSGQQQKSSPHSNSCSNSNENISIEPGFFDSFNARWYGFCFPFHIIGNWCRMNWLTVN